MRKTLFTMAMVIALALGMMGPAFAAGHAGGPSDNACFGQARAEGASDTFNPNNEEFEGKNIGEFFSERKGENAALNREFREDCR